MLLYQTEGAVYREKNNQITCHSNRKRPKKIDFGNEKFLQFSRRTGEPVNRPGEQLIELIADNDGKPLKGQKSYTMIFLETRYKKENVFSAHLTLMPECTILEGMFLINTTPLGSHKTMSEYAMFLIRRFIETQFTRGSLEVHVSF